LGFIQVDCIFKRGAFFLYALNLTDGTKIWNYTTGGSVVSSPCFANGVIYVGSYDGQLYAFGTTMSTRTITYDWIYYPIAVVIALLALITVIVIYSKRSVKKNKAQKPTAFLL
jgi:bacteriorhodopsin